MTGIARKALFFAWLRCYKINFEKKVEKIDLLQNSEIFFSHDEKWLCPQREKKKLAGSNWFRCWPIFFGIQSIKIPQKHEKFKTSKFFPQTNFFIIVVSLKSVFEKMLLPGCQIKVTQKYELDDATDKLANSILTD